MVDKLSKSLSQWKKSKFYHISVTGILILIYILLGEYLPLGSFNTPAATVITIALLYCWEKMEGQPFIENSLEAPKKWINESSGALLKALGIIIITLLIFFPLTELVIGSTPDYSKLVKVLEGNLTMLFIQLALVWTVVAFGEEIIFRGFVMTRIKKIVGNQTSGKVLNVLLSSILFGFLHSYQGISGQVITGLIGALLAVNFIYKKFNLWQNILIHGFVDTISIILFFFGWFPS